MSNNRKLLLFLTDKRYPEKTPIMATLAWLAKQEGITFDAYISRNIIEALGMKIDGFFFGDMHAEQLYYVCNKYDVHYCAYGVAKRFLNDLKVFNKKCLALKDEHELPDFYLEVFSYFRKDVPEEAVMVRSRPVDTNAGTANLQQLQLGSYCYPDIYHKEALGLGSNIADDELKRLREIGVKAVSTLYCEDETVEMLRNLGFKVSIIDSLKENDTYRSVTIRIADRWLHRAKGFATGDPELTAFWTPFFCRNDLICLYSTDWKSFAPILASYADKKAQDLIWGFQSSDHFITELSKFDKVMQIITYMKPLSIVEEHGEHRARLIKPSRTYWDFEYSDEELTEKADAGRIACCLLFFAENLCHSLTIPRIFELAKLTETKIGVGTNVSWYEFVQRWMEDTLIPLESGGCFPLVEPLLCSAGLGAATEAKGYISAGALLANLEKARRKVAEVWSEKLVPIGYYPWQDANPYYRAESGEPQFDVVKAAGFQYYITCKNMNQHPQIVYKDGDFIAINQQNSMLDLLTFTELLTGRPPDKNSAEGLDRTVRVPWTYSPLDDLKKWEKKLEEKGKPGWIILSMDSPFWGWSPFYFDRVHILKSAMEYIASKGKAGRLFSASPHEVARFARILEPQV